MLFRSVERIKAIRSDATIGADLIAGFPTESDEMSLNSLQLLDDCDIIAAHVFPFSPRPNTPAARMPQLARDVVKARAARLRQASEERRTRWLESLVGSTQRVLMESGGKAHTDAFAPVTVAGAQRGSVAMVRIPRREGDHLVGVRA